MTKKTDDTTVKQLLGDAHDQGALSATALAPPAAAGNTGAVRDGHNFVLDALRGSRQSGEVLAHTRYLNGHVLCPYVALDHAVTMTSANYQPHLATPSSRDRQ